MTKKEAISKIRNIIKDHAKQERIACKNRNYVWADVCKYKQAAFAEAIVIINSIQP